MGPTSRNGESSAVNKRERLNLNNFSIRRMHTRISEQAAGGSIYDKLRLERTQAIPGGYRQRKSSLEEGKEVAADGEK